MRETILLIDGENDLRNLLKKFLRPEDFIIYDAETSSI